MSFKCFVCSGDRGLRCLQYGIDNLTPLERGKLNREKYLCSPDDITPYGCSSIAKPAKGIA